MLCIIGDGRALNALFLVFQKAHENLTYAYERCQLYLAAEGNAPVLGFIAKAEQANPNDVMPFFEAWGINLPAHLVVVRLPRGLRAQQSHQRCK